MFYRFHQLHISQKKNAHWPQKVLMRETYLIGKLFQLTLFVNVRGKKLLYMGNQDKKPCEGNFS